MGQVTGFPETRVDEIVAGLYRISTGAPDPHIPGGFSFNQFLLKDESPLIVHTGPRAMFEAVRAAIASVMPLNALRYIAFSHYEADECGAMPALLAAAPQAQLVCGRLAAMLSGSDLTDRPIRALADGEELRLGARSLRWIDAPHVPHGWDNGYLAEPGGVLFCGDLLTQPGAHCPPLVTADILGPSEAMRAAMDYYAHGPNTAQSLERLAQTGPNVLACMHGSAWTGDGAGLLRELARKVSA